MNKKLNYNELVGDIIKELKADYISLLSSYKNEINKVQQYNDEVKAIKVNDAVNYYYNEARELKDTAYNKILTKLKEVQAELNKPIEDNRSIQEKILNELQKNNAFLEIKSQLEKDNITNIEKLYDKYCENSDIIGFIKANITGNDSAKALIEKISSEENFNQRSLDAWISNTTFTLKLDTDSINIGEPLSRNIADDFGKNQLVASNFFNV